MAAKTAPPTIAVQNDHPSFMRIPVPYAPIPKNTACPKSTYPVKPPVRFQFEARVISMNIWVNRNSSELFTRFESGNTVWASGSSARTNTTRPSHANRLPGDVFTAAGAVTAAPVPQSVAIRRTVPAVG